MALNRVALVAVHGVADQRAGDTARAVVDLLIAAAPDGVRYRAFAEERLTIGVEPLAPRSGAPPERADATPRGEDRPAVKGLMQSLRSDLQRSGWRAPEDLRTAWRARRADPNEAAADRGLATTNYLLTKHRDNGAEREAYETTRIGVERSAGDRRAHVDVYEMYWADLSRLSGALPRIVTELFTMVFRLSKLGRDTVDEARGWLARTRGSGLKARLFGFAWWLAAGLQIGLDWLFVNGLALLFLQLSLLTVVLVGLGLATMVEPSLLYRAAAGAVAVAGFLWLAYRYRDGEVRTVLGPLALVVAGAVPLLYRPDLLPWLTALVGLGLVTLGNEAGLRIADDRFPFVRSVGRWLWIGVLLVVLASAVNEVAVGRVDAADAIRLWTHATLFATEVTLLVVKWWWVIAGALLVVWLGAGTLAAFERGYESKASIATGRLGLAVSIGTFLMLTMAIWALVSTVLDLSVKGVVYSPCIFAVGAEAKVTDAAPTNTCLWSTAAAARQRAAGTGSVAPTAVAYLEDRYRGSTAAFSPLAALLLVLVLYLATMFCPSILAETKVLVQRTRDAFRQNVMRRRDPDPVTEAATTLRNLRTRRLGRWLTTGYRSLDSVVLAVAALGVLLGMIVAALFAAPYLGIDPGEAATPGGWRSVLERIVAAEPLATEASQSLLKPLVLGAASIAAALTLLGGLLSKYVPQVRAPLDIALDVDNHFREFPRSNIPRARIFSRYAALLGHLALQKYDRIVIVAHSQGTVISAELLRFLASDGAHAPLAGAPPRLGTGELAPINLLTLGCPLRQLYAARFPTLYRWVLARRTTVSGPEASDIGVERWANAFCSGDYVGRWLWSDSPEDGDAIGHPMLDNVDNRMFGREDAYGGFVPMPPEAVALAGVREIEVCLGLGAHTHYFEPTQSTVAWLIDYLLCAPAIATGAAPHVPR